MGERDKIKQNVYSVSIMRGLQPSRTAEYMALFRAVETAGPADRRLFDDPYAALLLSGTLKTVARIACMPIAGRLVRAILDFGWPYTRSSGVVRTRLIDDLVRDGIRDGAEQLLLLGAGFDSRAYRLGEAKGIAVFEVDHPATQRVKRERLKALFGQSPANVCFVEVDFEKDDLEDKLIEAGFDTKKSTVVVWEGVVSYLTESAVHGTLAVLARLLAPGSHLILTYMHKGALDGSGTFKGARRWKSWVRFSGEPFIFGFDPANLAEALRPLGFLLKNDVSTEEAARHYCGPIGRDECGSEAYRAATAIRAGE